MGITTTTDMEPSRLCIDSAIITLRIYTCTHPSARNHMRVPAGTYDLPIFAIPYCRTTTPNETWEADGNTPDGRASRTMTADADETPPLISPPIEVDYIS
ncbi:hypothetical protein DF200_01405 [Bifidobacterium catulorum]|uniref:Uncharacterized protein n=1 Tax=Bifidobacterium catulorum TaxID=1630173 RepID=A0A2U2MUM1_9BIFI|nr:hypothetical protein DF200_01405 [Bifidobacterium catulorum]